MLEKINQIFGDIKDAIVQQGVEVGDCDSPDTYADRILQIDVCNNAEDCEEGGEGGGGSSSSKGYVYFFFPAFRASEKQPDTPSGSIRSLFTVTSGNYVQTLNYPSGWASATVAIANEVAKYDMTANPTLNPMWMSYCIVAIRNDSPSYYMDWTTPLCLGYPYANPTSDEWVGNGGNGGNGGSDNNYYNGSRTFLIYAELGSTGYTLSTPVGGTWDTETNQLVGDVTSNSSNGQVRWSVNNNHTPGMYTYISIGTFGYDGNIIGTWSDPFCINASNGKDGRNGVDGVNIEFIYKLCANLDAFSELTTPESNRNINGSVPTGWTATPSGVDGTSYRVEACSTRKLETSTRWSAWSKPVIWAMWSDGSDGGGSGGGSGSGSGSGGNGYTFTVEYWYKLSNQDTGITSPALRYEDPTTTVAGSWSKSPSNPTTNLQYLWCFVQINYNRTLSNGYTYTRSDAYIVRHFDYETSAEFSAVAEMLNTLKADLSNKMLNYESEFLDLNNSLNDFKATLESQVLLSHLSDTTSRVDAIERTGTTELTEDGLWGMLTSYRSPHDGTGSENAKKAFSDIVLDAENAKTTLNNGAALVDSITNAGFTVNGLGAEMEAFASKTYVTGKIDATLWNLDSSSISTSVSKGQKGWKQTSTERLYPYTHHFEPDPDDADCFNMTGHTLEDFEEYMQSSQSNPYTTNDENDVYYGQSKYPSDGPFTLITVINEFSTIKQTADSIEASVQNNIKQLRNINDSSDIQPYDKFESDYNTHLEQNPSYINTSYNQSLFANLYEYWLKVDHVPQYEVIKIGEALSDIIQTSDEIKQTVGTAKYMWRRPRRDGGYSYKAYEIPINTSQSTYEANVIANTTDTNNEFRGPWERFEWNEKMSVIDQTQDEVTIGVKNNSKYWIKQGTENADKSNWREGTDYRRYNYWIEDWETAKANHYNDSDYDTKYKNYDTWVASATRDNSYWILVDLPKSAAAISVTSDRIDQQVQTLDGRISAIELSPEHVRLASSAKEYVWELNNGEYCAYDYFRTNWLATNPSSTTDSDYETWLLSNNSLEVYGKVLKNDIGALTIKHDKILLGVGGDDDGNYAAAISIKKGDTPAESKIILDANTTQIDGELVVGAVNNATTKISGNTIATGTIVADKLNATVIDNVKTAVINEIYAGNVTANTLESIDEDFTKRILIEDGKAEFYLWDDQMNDNDGGWRKRIEIGVEGSNNNDLVLKFFDENGTELYNLGPAGLKNTTIGKYVITDQYGTWEY